MTSPSDTARLHPTRPLGVGAYRFHAGAWEIQAPTGQWYLSMALEGEGYAGGVQIIAECNWASVQECPHQDFDSLKVVAGSFEDDHTLEAVRCRNCGEWFIATVWSTDREAELVPMSPAELAQYKLLWHEVP